MAITVLNEWEYTDASIPSDVNSIFSKLKLYYKATITNVSYSTVKVENTVTANDITFRAVEIDEDVSFKYFVLIGDEFFKFWFYNQGGQDMPEFKSIYDGEFVSSDISQPIKFTISTYNSSDALIESSTEEYYISPLSVNLPSSSGFNLYDFFTIKTLRSIKLSNNTFNEVILNSATNSTNIEINNLTTGKQLYNTTTPDSSAGTKTLYFEKRIQNIWVSDFTTKLKPYDNTGVITFALGTYNYDEIENIKITYNKTIYSDDGSTNNRDELVLTYSADPDETYTVTQQKDNNPNHIEFNVSPTATSGTITITLKIDNADAFSTEHIWVDNLRAVAEFTPEYSNYILAKGVNKIEVLHTTYGIFKVFEIDYNINNCYVNLLFNHPTLGYASYPFEGMKIESANNSKGDTIDVFNETLIDVNKLQELQSITSKTNISISSQVDSKYWDIIKEIYNSRHVYLYVGEDGGLDNELNWLYCEVSGSPSINYNKNKSSALFTVNLTLPEKFNNSL